MEHDLDPARAAIRRDLFGGRGAVRVWDLGARTPPFTAVLFCELDPGGSVGVHVQETDDEVVIVVGGRGSISVDGSARSLGVGGAVALPLRSRLAIENLSSDEPLRYLIVKARK